MSDKKKEKRYTADDLDDLESRFWLGNREAVKLWNVLGKKYRSRGWSWSKFLKVLGVCHGEIVLYMMGETQHHEFAAVVAHYLDLFEPITIG